MTSPVSDAERRAIEQDCGTLALRSMLLNDDQAWDRLCDLFTETASFARPTDPDNPLVGREAIRAAFKARPANRLTCHLCTSVVVDVIDADHATGRATLTLFTADAANTAANPVMGVMADHKKFIGFIEDDYLRTTDGWRIDRRQGRITLTVE
jgi:hypothetical protein